MEIKRKEEYEKCTYQKTHEIIDKDLDVREKWAGIRQLKTPYKPIPYSQKRKFQFTSNKHFFLIKIIFSTEE